MTVIHSGCLPIPVSTVPFHPREARPIMVESALSENGGVFSSPAFDSGGGLIAVYDSGINRVRIMSSSDLSPVNSLKPTRWPMRLGFSPGGNFLSIRSHQGWVENYLAARPEASRIDIDSPEAIRDDIQRAEIWDLRTGQAVSDLRCDAEETSAPKGGWLWAHKKAIFRGYRSSAILAAQFSSNDGIFSLLCYNGVQQQWDTRNWQRLEDISPPPFWREMTRFVNAGYWTGNSAAGQSADGQIAILSVRMKSLGFGSTHVWNRAEARVRSLPGKCGTRCVPVYSLSTDKKRLALACNSGFGYVLRAWDLDSQQEIPLKGANFGLIKGMPLIRGEGVAVSPDGHYLAAALLNQAESMVAPAGISRSDLRLWSLEQGGEVAAVAIDELVSYADYFRGVDLAFSPDSTLLALGGKRLRMYHTSRLVIPEH